MSKEYNLAPMLGVEMLGGQEDSIRTLIGAGSDGVAAGSSKAEVEAEAPRVKESGWSWADSSPTGGAEEEEAWSPLLWGERA